jgi:hypothetical protein
LAIGAKEGVVEASTKLVSSNIADAILWTAGSSNHKSINEFTLYEVMKVAINSTNQPSTNNVLKQLIKMINHTFDFCKKVSINMELMQSNTAQTTTYGIVIGIPQLTRTLLANIKMATKSNYSRKFCSAMHAIRKKFTCNHAHNVALLQIILKELVGADRVQVLKDALAPGAGIAHLVADLVSYLQAMMDGDTDSMYAKLVFGMNSDSNLSEEERKQRRRDCKKSEHSKWTRTTSQRRTCALTARSSIARTLIKSNWTGANGTRNTRAIASN